MVGVSLGGSATAGTKKTPKRGSAPRNPSLYPNQGNNVTILLVDQVDSDFTLSQSIHIHISSPLTGHVSRGCGRHGGLCPPCRLVSLFPFRPLNTAGISQSTEE